MTQFSLKIVSELNTFHFDSISTHELPRVGELVDVGSLYDLVPTEHEALGVRVTAIVHPVSSRGTMSVASPIVYCDYTAGVSKRLYMLMSEDSRWETTRNPNKIPIL